MSDEVKLVTFGRFYHACYQETIERLKSRMCSRYPNLLAGETVVNGNFDIVHVVVTDGVRFFHGWRKIYIPAMHTVFATLGLYMMSLSDEDLKAYVNIYLVSASLIDFPQGEPGSEDVGYDLT